jgi:hypothetical protein
MSSPTAETAPAAETGRSADFGNGDFGDAESTESEINSYSALEPVFPEAVTADFRSRWDEVQRGFVDDPNQAVKAGDELVTQVIQSLAESFDAQRRQSDGHIDAARDSTENLRVALRRYRSLFERLLTA